MAIEAKNFAFVSYVYAGTTVFWIALTLFWVLHIIWYWNYRIPLQRALLTIPITKISFLITAFIFYFDCSWNAVPGKPATCSYLLNLLMNICYSCYIISVFSNLLLISRGYCITQRELLPGDKRSIFWFSLAIVIFCSFYLLSSFSIGVIVVLMIIAINCYSSMSSQVKKLETHQLMQFNHIISNMLHQQQQQQQQQENAEIPNNPIANVHIQDDADIESDTTDLELELDGQVPPMIVQNSPQIEASASQPQQPQQQQDSDPQNPHFTSFSASQLINWLSEASNSIFLWERRQRMNPAFQKIKLFLFLRVTILFFWFVESIIFIVDIVLSYQFLGNSSSTSTSNIWSWLMILQVATDECLQFVVCTQTFWLLRLRSFKKFEPFRNMSAETLENFPMDDLFNSINRIQQVENQINNNGIEGFIENGFLNSSDSNPYSNSERKTKKFWKPSEEFTNNFKLKVEKPSFTKEFLDTFGTRIRVADELPPILLLEIESDIANSTPNTKIEESQVEEDDDHELQKEFDEALNKSLISDNERADSKDDKVTPGELPISGKRKTRFVAMEVE